MTETESIRAEAQRLKGLLADCLTGMNELFDGHDIEATCEPLVDRIYAVLSSTPATQREIDRIKAMERVVEAAKKQSDANRNPANDSTPVYYTPEFVASIVELDDALKAYDKWEQKFVVGGDSKTS